MNILDREKKKLQKNLVLKQFSARILYLFWFNRFVGLHFCCCCCLLHRTSPYFNGCDAVDCGVGEDYDDEQLNLVVDAAAVVAAVDVALDHDDRCL